MKERSVVAVMSSFLPADFAAEGLCVVRSAVAAPIVDVAAQKGAL